MNRRLTVITAAVTAFAVGIVSPARAQETQLGSPVSFVRPTTWVTPDGSPELRRQLTIARMHAESATPFQLDAPMKEVRLSHGAKMAIIITAIVVGALIIVGAVALGRPGKRL